MGVLLGSNVGVLVSRGRVVLVGWRVGVNVAARVVEIGVRVGVAVGASVGDSAGSAVWVVELGMDVPQAASSKLIEMSSAMSLFISASL